MAMGHRSPGTKNRKIHCWRPPFDVALLAEVLTEIKKVISHRRLPKYFPVVELKGPNPAPIGEATSQAGEGPG